MAKIKFKDARNLSKAEKERKLKELRLELIKSQTKQSKTGSSKSKQIKRTIARLLTIKVKWKYAQNAVYMNKLVYVSKWEKVHRE